MTFRPILLAPTLAAGLILTGCSGTPLDGIVDGLVGTGAEQVTGGVDDLVAEALGGANIAADGSLPSGFPRDRVPLVGEVIASGSAPDGIGWAVQLRVDEIATFDEAGESLEAAGFAASGDVSVGAESAIGTFTSEEYSVVLNYAVEGGSVTATYLVAPVSG